MRKALIVGIDHYHHIASLNGCVKDAYAVKGVLERHADGTVNFATPRLFTASSPNDAITKPQLKTAIREVFDDDSEIALFYFAGHGFIEDTGGFLCTSDTESGDDGVSINELMTIAGQSAARNKVIMLDSCHGGVAGSGQQSSNIAQIVNGMTILTASTANQYAEETPSGGVFTNLLVDALEGAAANLVGDVTPGSVYAHIDQSLGPWAQRPVFKTNVKTFVSLRKASAPIPFEDLAALAIHFPSDDYEFKLDPSFEPERSPEQAADTSIPAPSSTNTAVFAVLQRYARVNLVRPVGAPHMWHAAMQNQSCELTVLGQHYRRLVATGVL